MTRAAKQDYRTPRRAERDCEHGHRDHEGECASRAAALWPRLDRGRLSRCHDDPRRIAGVVAHRTSLPYESILKLLAEEPSDPVEAPPLLADEPSDVPDEPSDLADGAWNLLIGLTSTRADV